MSGGPQDGWPAALQRDGASLVVHMRAPLDPGEVQQVCAALRGVLDVERSGADADRVVCHVHGPPDVSVVGALARLNLLCRRLEVPVRMRGAEGDLDALLHLTGLEDVVPGRV